MASVFWIDPIENETSIPKEEEEKGVKDDK